MSDNVVRIEERLPRPNKWVIAITGAYRCMAYVDDKGAWRDANRHEVVEGVQAWISDSDEEASPPSPAIKPAKINFINRHGQRVIDVTQLPGNDSKVRVYILRCGHCLNEYAVNPIEVWEKSCPACQGEAGRSASH